MARVRSKNESWRAVSAHYIQTDPRPRVPRSVRAQPGDYFQSKTTSFRALPSVRALVGTTWIDGDVPPPPATGHVERSGVETSLRIWRDRADLLVFGEASPLRPSVRRDFGRSDLHSLGRASPAHHRSYRAERSRDISTASATLIRDASPRRGFSTSPLFRRGSGRSGLYSLGRAFLARYWSCRAERSGAETHAGPEALGPRVEATRTLQGLPSPALSLPFSSLALRSSILALRPLSTPMPPHSPSPCLPAPTSPRAYRSSAAISALTTATSTVI